MRDSNIMQSTSSSCITGHQQNGKASLAVDTGKVTQSTCKR
jgi:hypothetical protein